MGWEPGGRGSTLAAAGDLSSKEFQICEVGITTLPPLTQTEAGNADVLSKEESTDWR